MKVNLLNILFFCVLVGMIIYMVKDVRDAWKLSPKKFGPGVRFIRCVLLAFFYVFPFLLTIVAPFGYGLYAFILGVVISALPIYFIMKPVWAVRPFERLLRKRYGIKQAPRKKKRPVDAEENQAEPESTENSASSADADGKSEVPDGENAGHVAEYANEKPTSEAEHEEKKREI